MEKEVGGQVWVLFLALCLLYLEWLWALWWDLTSDLCLCFHKHDGIARLFTAEELRPSLNLRGAGRRRGGDGKSSLCPPSPLCPSEPPPAHPPPPDGVSPLSPGTWRGLGGPSGLGQVWRDPGRNVQWPRTTASIYHRGAVRAGGGVWRSGLLVNGGVSTEVKQ